MTRSWKRFGAARCLVTLTQTFVSLCHSIASISVRALACVPECWADRILIRLTALLGSRFNCARSLPLPFTSSSLGWAGSGQVPMLPFALLVHCSRSRSLAAPSPLGTNPGRSKGNKEEEEERCSLFCMSINLCIARECASVSFLHGRRIRRTHDDDNDSEQGAVRLK